MADNTIKETPGAADSEVSFEDALAELDEVVRALEMGNIPLGDSLKLLQRGIELASLCDGTLSQAEAVLEQLTVTADGELSRQRLQWIEDDDAGDEDGREEEDDE